MSNKKELSEQQSELITIPESPFYLEQLTNLQLLEALKKVNFLGYREMASDPKTSPEALFFMAENDFKIDVKCSVASNPNTPQAALNHLICLSSLYSSNDKKKLFFSLSQNDNIHREGLYLISKLTDNTQTRIEIVKKINDPTILSTFAKEVSDSLNNDDPFERYSAPDLESKIEHSNRIRLAVLLASNPNLTYEAKIALADCGYKVGYQHSISHDSGNLAGYLKYLLFTNNLDNISLLKELLNRDGGMESNNFQFKCLIAKFNQTPPEILQTLSLQGGFVVQEYAINNPNIPIEFLRNLIQSENENSKSARIAIAKRTKNS